MRHVTFFVLVIACGAGGVARAEGPLVVRVGAGLAFDRWSVKDAVEYGDHRYGPGLQLDAGIRVRPELAVGAHLGLMRSWGTDTEYRNPDFYSFDMVYTSIQLGVSVQYVVRDRYWIAPWIGVDDKRISGESTTSTSDARLGLGLDLGADLWRRQGHRFGVYAEIAGSRQTDFNPYAGPDGRDITQSDLYLTVGASYRYW